ncbi:MAG: glycosyltransferase family 4 protein [Candidatus Bilamarchaeaceae archaeon]
MEYNQFHKSQKDSEHSELIYNNFIKIAFVQDSDLHLFLFRLSWMKALKERGFRVYAIVPKGEYWQAFRANGIITIKCPIHEGNLDPLKAIFAIFQLYRIFRKERFKIVHNFTIKGIVLGTLAAKLAGIPIIVNQVTGVGYTYTDKRTQGKLLRFVISFLLFFSFCLSSKIVFQNTDDLETLKHLLKNKNIVIIKGSGVDTDYFSPQNVKPEEIEKLRKQLSVKKTDIVVTFIGRLLLHKGLNEFVEAARILLKNYQHIVFLVVGWLDKGNPSAVTRKFIQQAQQNPCIKFVGKRTDIREILALTDIYVLPSYREGVPRSTLEAMAMEKPIVTTNTPGCRETVEEGVNGFLVPPKDDKALAIAIEKLILDKDLRHRMGRKSREKVVREFSTNIVIEKVMSLYQDLLKMG